MEILAFVDLHGSAKALKKIETESKKAGLIVCAGDLTIFENNITRLFARLNKLGKPVLIIPGNHESNEHISYLTNVFENIEDIHEKAFAIGNYLFLGYGGGGFSMVDKHFERISKNFEKKIIKFRKHNQDAKIILITHAPPYNTKIDNIMGNPCGNKSIKNFIKKVRPDLVVSGHLHENAGKEDKEGKTLLVNPGPFGKIVEV